MSILTKDSLMFKCEVITLLQAMSRISDIILYITMYSQKIFRACFSGKKPVQYQY